MSSLQIGAQVGKDDLQGAADKLVQSGLFAKVKYNFQSRTDGLVEFARRNFRIGGTAQPVLHLAVQHGERCGYLAV